MNKILILFLVMLLTSCQLFDKKVPDEKELLQQELQKINWNQVDQYPSVASCDTILDKETQKQCLFDFLIETIQNRIGIDTIHILYPELDTISVKVTINPDATLQFQTEIPQDSISYDIKVIDSILQNRLSDFPTVEPAIKQGIKVKSQFVLPVILNVTE
ncbi:hypothetical protein NHF50_08395 [Flavobacterium sp. NRK F10]|uniref:Uncharacterized protein n=1 Tax=Flavobacterium sediminis TaxID=2201181 RepID=A0A2U8QUV6_9FLAO|nr:MULTISPECIES: hypothetical protein [Flavobacterium]AWM13913.1 hypothetical protein DI487_08580 [Flavobacterium sediminis]MCO6175065.1 hypothetical protein [Flavobacterium sp. NRK F10]